MSGSSGRPSVSDRAIVYLAQAQRDSLAGLSAGILGALLWADRRQGRVSAVQGGGDYAAQMLLGRLRKQGLVCVVSDDRCGAGSSMWTTTPSGAQRAEIVRRIHGDLGHAHASRGDALVPKARARDDDAAKRARARSRRRPIFVKADELRDWVDRNAMTEWPSRGVAYAVVEDLAPAHGVDDRGTEFVLFSRRALAECYAESICGGNVDRRILRISSSRPWLSTWAREQLAKRARRSR